MLRLSGMHLTIHSSLQYLSIHARLYLAKGMAAIPEHHTRAVLLEHMGIHHIS